MSLDVDWQIRLAAFDQVRAMRGPDGLVSAADLNGGFMFDGQRIALWSDQRGIWRPTQLRDAGGAALTVFTSPVVKGKRRPYDDQVASDEPRFVYRYQGDNPNQWDNVAVRRAMEMQRPLLYLYGVSKGIYHPIFPCYVTGEDPTQLAFFLASDAVANLDANAPTIFTPAHELRRAYATRAVKVRIHQETFSQMVVSAYNTSCAVCRIKHKELLDAAHILPDRDERGRPEVPNGLALCKIHHAAYDANILGITPDYKVEIRLDVLKERDGPMLQHGLQEMHHSPLNVPRSTVLRPNKDYLDERYQAFRRDAA
jgi:putative restriction endonuclease